MTLSIKQHVAPHPKQTNYWSWRVWLDGDTAELDSIDSVRYQLHQTFPEPTRVITDRASKFLLKSAGWGEFMIYVRVSFKTRRKPVSLRHYLRLDMGFNEGGDADAPAPRRVFLSYGLADSHFAQRVRKALLKRNVQVISTETDIPAGSDFMTKTLEMIGSAEAGVVLVSDSDSPWVTLETDTLLKMQKPLVPVVIERDKKHRIPVGLRELQAVRVGPDEDANLVASKILATFTPTKV